MLRNGHEDQPIITGGGGRGEGGKGKDLSSRLTREGEAGRELGS